MEVMEAIRKRRAVRSYTSTQVSGDLIRTLLEAATWAPSAMNQQPWAFVVIQETDTLRRISEDAKRAALASAAPDPAHHGLRELLESPVFDVFYHAGTLIVICATSTGPFAAGDCCLAAQNLMLAAHALGLASCPIGLSLPALRQPDLMQELGIPSGYAPVFAAVLGFPGEIPPMTTRHEPEILAWLGGRP